MGRERIKRVWGGADNFALDFAYSEKKKRWVSADFPPDFEDGQYVCELFAEHINGNISIWTGILYVSNGAACLHIKQEPFRLVLLKECRQHG